MSHRSIDGFIIENKGQMIEFLKMATESRLKHTNEDRLIAVELMVCAIGASLKNDARDDFLKIMNSFSTTQDPMKNKTVKAIADLNVLSTNFNNFYNPIPFDE